MNGFYQYGGNGNYQPYPQQNQSGSYNNSQQNYYQSQPAMQPQVYIPMTYVNGIEGAKAFIVAPNQTIYLKDDDNGVLYEKKANYQGRAFLTPYKLTPITLEEIGNGKLNYPDSQFASKADLKQLESAVIDKINNLSNLIQNISSHPQQVLTADSNTKKGDEINEQ